jgi:hypothetical protein
VALRKEGNKIFIKYNKENHIGYFSKVISVGVSCGIIIGYYNRFNSKFKWLNMALQSSFIKISLIIGVIIFMIISIMDKLFYSDFNYYLDLETKKIHLINGRWKFRKEEIIDFENIKNIVIIKTQYLKTKYKTGDMYKIDLYDRELNAYEIFDSINYNHIKKVAMKIQNTINSEIIERINVNDYEGFRKRII